ISKDNVLSNVEKDTKGKKVVAYMDQLPQEELCLIIKQERVAPVGNLQKTPVKAYSYYDMYDPTPEKDPHPCELCHDCKGCDKWRRKRLERLRLQFATCKAKERKLEKNIAKLSNKVKALARNRNKAKKLSRMEKKLNTARDRLKRQQEKCSKLENEISALETKR
ncbi:unnamed protein product, partial [Owenia fusiformis]